MECSDCCARLPKSAYVCGCNGIFLCKGCISRHVGKEHFLSLQPQPQEFTWEDGGLAAFDELVVEVNKHLQQKREILKTKIKQDQVFKLKKTNRLSCNTTNIIKAIDENIEYLYSKLSENLIEEISPSQDFSKLIPIEMNEKLCLVDPVVPRLYLHKQLSINLKNFSIVAYNQGYLLIGGHNNAILASKKIYLDTSEEFPVSLRHGRFFHASVIHDSCLYVIGGSGDQESATTLEVINLKLKSYVQLVDFSKMKFSYQVPVATIIGKNLLITFVQDNQEKLHSLDIPQLLNGKIVQYRDEDLEFGKFCFTEKAEARFVMFKDSDYSWVSSEAKVIDRKLYLVRPKDLSLITYDLESKRMIVHSI